MTLSTLASVSMNTGAACTAATVRLVEAGDDIGVLLRGCVHQRESANERRPWHMARMRVNNPRARTTSSEQGSMPLHPSPVQARPVEARGG